MLLDKSESKSSLRSEFSGNFRSGLKLPTVLDRNKLPSDESNSVTPSTPTRRLSEKKFRVLLPLKTVSPEPILLPPSYSPPASDDALSSSLSKIKRNSRKLRSRTRSVPVRRMIEEGGDGDWGNVRSDLQITPSSSQELSLHSNAGDSGKSISKKGKGKSKDIDTEINHRISSVYRSIETLAKKRINFDNSIRAATRRTVADGARNKNILAAVASAAATKLEGDSVARDETEGGQKSSRIIDVTRTYPKMFGLDPMKVIASSEDDSEEEAKGDPRKKTKKSIRKYLEQLVKDEQPRDMSAIMPTLSEKTFLTKLQKRESQLNKEIHDMRNSLDVMNMKAEREAKKAQVDRKKLNALRPNTRLIPSEAKKGPARELSDFLQATGGLTGGWEQEDHQVFLRAYQKWSSRPTKFVENLTKLLPNKKPEDIIDHRNWYEKHEKLNAANREHIRQWQANKKKERESAYQKASDSQNARKDAERRSQELLRVRRSTEREKNKELLEEWKRKAGSSRRKNTSEIGNTERIAQLDQEMSGIRKEIQQITAMTKDMGKSLQTVGTKEKEGDGVRKVKGLDRARTALSDASSGFCEMSMEEMEALGKELEGDGEKFLRNRVTTAQPHHHIRHRVSFKTKRDPSIKSKLLQEFRSRDDELVQAKKKAIMGRKEKLRNRSFLTDDQVKERMKKISTPSKFMSPTKGWMIRKEIREIEKVESRNRAESNELNDAKDSFTPAAYVKNIPKLGVPSWRKSAA